jgi:hypothetical protein
MPGEKRRGQRSDERQPRNTAAPAQRTRKPTSDGGCVALTGNSTVAPVHCERLEFYCLTCDHEADATYLGEWKIGSHSNRCPSGGECLRGIAEQVGCKPHQLLSDPRPWLESVATVRGTRASRPQALPTRDELTQCLLAAATGKPKRYLRKQRGLTRKTIVQAGIGYGCIHGRAPGFVIPVYDVDGGGRRVLVNVRVRHWPEPWGDAKISGLRGRGTQLYPKLPKRGPVILCEGEFDALLGWQHGLPTVSTTCGATLPAHLADRFGGRCVDVCYDVGADTRKTVERLVAAGAKQVRVVDLAAGGLRKSEDLTDFFVWYGKTANALRRLIRRAEVVR